MEQKEKHMEYAELLINKVAEMFSEDDINYIDLSEMSGDDLTEFFHALSNLMPSHFYNKLTGDNKNILQFNYLANQLVFQYSNKKQK